MLTSAERARMIPEGEIEAVQPWNRHLSRPCFAEKPEITRQDTRHRPVHNHYLVGMTRPDRFKTTRILWNQLLPSTTAPSRTIVVGVSR